MGRALMGRREGDAFVVKTPGGDRELEVLSVRYEPQPSLPEPEWRKQLQDGPVSIEKA